MSHFSTKGWVCKVSDARLRETWAEMNKSSGWWRGIPHAWWRQIRITAAASHIEISLMDVNQEAALGGYWSCGYACRDFKLTWVDLNDLDSLPTFFSDEAPGVWEKFDSLVQPLRDDMAALRRALAA